MKIDVIFGLIGYGFLSINNTFIWPKMLQNQVINDLRAPKR